MNYWSTTLFILWVFPVQAAADGGKRLELGKSSLNALGIL